MTKHKQALLLAAGGLTLSLAGSVLAEPTAPSVLPTFDIDPTGVSVVGVSSGGYMATQLAVAYPETFHGLGVFAAGPWGCAQGSLRLALGQCMTLRHGLPSLAELNERFMTYQAAGRLESTHALADQRVYIWHGEADSIVAPPLSDILAEQYRQWLASPTQLRRVSAEHAGHGWPVANHAGLPASGLADCQTGGSPHLLACQQDAVGEALRWLYGELDEPDPSARGTLLPFDQSEFYQYTGFADQGYLYLPKICEEGAQCGLVVALHGCNMSTEHIDERFVRHSGLNEWAATNHWIVLYPQTEPSLANPQGCWDWWGFAESSWALSPTYDGRDGRQVQGLMNMVKRLAGDAE